LIEEDLFRDLILENLDDDDKTEDYYHSIQSKYKKQSLDKQN